MDTQVVRRKRVFVGVLSTRTVSHPCTGEVFTVDVPHQRVLRGCCYDTVGSKLEGLNKNNMSQSGDVMVSMTVFSRLS